jgi:transcription elongation factor GreA
MTWIGIRKLEDELDRRKGEGRTEIAERIKQALSFGDISENSEYDDAKNAQAENEARVAEIEAILKHAKVIDDEDISVQKVTIGAMIKIREESSGEEAEYMLVSAKEEDIFSNKISSDSPVGSAILGKKKGQVVEVHSPSGMIKYKVIKISRPERGAE